MSTSAPSLEMTFILSICDMCRRGDIAAIVESFKGYWREKERHPWHRVYATLKSEGPVLQSEKQLAETLLLLRDSVFAALRTHSLSLALDVKTRELLEMILSAESWNEGRQRARAYLLEQVMDKINKKRLEHLVVSGLLHDDFPQAAAALQQAQLEQYQQARPKTDGTMLDLKRLARSVHGARLLRQLDIKINEIRCDDPRASQLLEKYEQLLVELETESIADVPHTTDYVQVTLDGELVSASDTTTTQAIEHQPRPIQGTSTSAVDGSKTVQLPLTEYLSSDESQEKKVSSEQQTSKKRTTRRRKKKDDTESTVVNSGEVD